MTTANSGRPHRGMPLLTTSRPRPAQFVFGRVYIEKGVAPFGISLLNNWNGTSVMLKQVCYMHVVSLQASAVTMYWAFMIMIGCIFAGGKFESGSLSLLGMMFFVVRGLIWFLLRDPDATVVFGAHNASLDDMTTKISRTDINAMAQRFLTDVYSSVDPGDANLPMAMNDETRVSTTKRAICIPNGEDSLEMYDKHFKITSKTGLIGMLTGVRVRATLPRIPSLPTRLSTCLLACMPPGSLLSARPAHGGTPA